MIIEYGHELIREILKWRFKRRSSHLGQKNNRVKSSELRRGFVRILGVEMRQMGIYRSAIRSHCKVLKSWAKYFEITYL